MWSEDGSLMGGGETEDAGGGRWTAAVVAVRSLPRPAKTGQPERRMILGTGAAAAQNGCMVRNCRAREGPLICHCERAKTGQLEHR